MEKTGLNFSLLLQREYSKRCKRNPKYSLRSFAQYLQTDASSISQLMSGKRKASAKLIEKLCGILGIGPFEKELLLDHSKSISGEDMDFRQLTMDAFSVISDWYHYAILDLTVVKGFQSHPTWIAKQLDITVTEAKSAVDRLKRLGLLIVQNEKLVKTEKLVTNSNGEFNKPAQNDLQRQIIKMALEAVDNTPSSEKDITSMTMAIDEDKLDDARAMVKNFRRKMCKFLEAGKQTRVYHLGIQLYPVSKRND